jgi:curved DNA-binding protein CbpA
MGNVSTIPDTHVRIFKNLYNIRSSETRIQMIETLLTSSEHVGSMKQAGVYGQLLHYIQQVKSGKTALLPGEKPLQPQEGQQPQSQPQQQLQVQQGRGGSKTLVSTGTEKGNERALNYFSACLRILELEEEVALTDSTLKKAYKKAALRAHPDKGGSEKEFEAVTRAYAYLGEIIQRIHGGRMAEGNVEAPTVLNDHRSQVAEKWKMVDPVSLNPDKLDLNTFNTMFDKTRIPDPDDSGYGDWLKGEDTSSSVKFGGKFNRDVFHKAFEEEQKSRASSHGGAIVAQELSMASRMGYGVELGRSGREDYTVAANERGMGYTDLKKAYTEYNTFSHQTAGVKVDSRSLESVSKERKSAPTPLANSEMAALAEAEAAMLRREENRRLTMAQEAVSENNYFERMKRLVIRNS